ncbi:hypothetical protein B0H14DRAFT_1072785 [Mycena olivaceomarginata]|nr:hypothetical protein B0H14DRAFT_1072785 [Mycena olivaceomarginata]
MCAADLLIIFGTIFSLRQSTGSEFTSTRTNSLVSRIIRLTAETGGLCMVFVLVDIYLFASYKGTNYHLAVCIELSKIYSNSILLVHFSFGRRKKTRINSLDSRSSTRGHIWDTAAPTIRTTTPASICPLLYSVGANVQQLVLRLRLGNSRLYWLFAERRKYLKMCSCRLRLLRQLNFLNRYDYNFSTL